MIDEALNYLGTVISKFKDIYSPLNLKDLSTKAGSSKKLLYEYEIISRNSNMDRTSDADGNDEEDNEDEGGYAVARSFPIIHQVMGAVSTSEPEFPKLFHQQDDSATSESCSLIQPLFMQQDPLYADWLVNESRPSAEVQNVYKKVATWVFAQQRFMHRTDHDDDEDNADGTDDLQYNDYYSTFYNGGCKGSDDDGGDGDGGGEIFMDEMEMIDPLDLFDESLLSDFLLLTRSSSEKRILLREFAHYKYNMLTVREATKSCEGSHYLKKPYKEACFEMSEILRQNSEVQCEEKQRFLTIGTVLEDYACYDQDGIEIDANLRIDDAASCSSEGSSVKDDGDAENREFRSNDLDIVSYHCSEVMQQNITSDDCTSLTYPTDVIDITSALVPEIISVSDDNESDVWEDARAIPHWLDFETDDHLFTQPHRPFYYYRDRIKGCYRIIGVEDEPVILFSGNDDDSIFYGCENEQRNVRDIRRSHSLGLLNSSIHKASDTSPPKSFIASQLNIVHTERRNDSGIEDVEDSVVDETLTETALSAKECHEMGRITRVIRTKEPKTVTFKLENSRPLFYDYFFVVFAALCVICSVISYFFAIHA